MLENKSFLRPRSMGILQNINFEDLHTWQYWTKKTFILRTSAAGNTEQDKTSMLITCDPYGDPGNIETESILRTCDPGNSEKTQFW